MSGTRANVRGWTFLFVCAEKHTAKKALKHNFRFFPFLCLGCASWISICRKEIFTHIICPHTNLISHIKFFIEYREEREANEIFGLVVNFPHLIILSSIFIHMLRAKKNDFPNVRNFISGKAEHKCLPFSLMELSIPLCISSECDHNHWILLTIWATIKEFNGRDFGTTTTKFI
jgi:hypothetical protein